MAWIWRPLGNSLIAPSATHGGVDPSASPENMTTGIWDLTGSMKLRGTFPAGHSAHAAK
jgi:hypothetical protein